MALIITVKFRVEDTIIHTTGFRKGKKGKVRVRDLNICTCILFRSVSPNY